jgi:hypothetical protein
MGRESVYTQPQGTAIIYTHFRTGNAEMISQPPTYRTDHCTLNILTCDRKVSSSVATRLADS